MRVVMMMVALMVGCSRDKDAEIAALRAKLAEGVVVKLPEPAAPTAPTTVALPKSATKKPYVDAEWCIFHCFRKAVAQEAMTPSSSNAMLRFAALNENGARCANDCKDGIANAVGCGDAEEQRDDCELLIKGADSGNVCEMLEMGMIGYCCDHKLLAKRTCKAVRAGIMDLPRDKRAALLHAALKP